MIRRLFASLFAAPSKGAAPTSIIPGLAPTPNTASYHRCRAHRAGAAVNLAYGQWIDGHSHVLPAEIAQYAEEAALQWARFASPFSAEANETVNIPNTPRDMVGGNQ